MKTSRSARTPRFFHDGELHAHTELQLSKKASHHLVTVMRTKEQDRIELFNGDGYNYAATVTSSGQRTPGKRAQLTIEERNKANTESPLSLILVQAISRGDRMDTCLRQSVELGVTHIQPVYSHHSAKPLDEQRIEKKITHWNNIIISACEQSGRATVPILGTPVGLIHWLENAASERDTISLDPSTQRIDYILSPHADNTLAAHLSTQTRLLSSCALVIGPESGFDADEINCAISTGVQSVQFGNRILRTETAGPACIAVMQSMLGDLRQLRL
ncbi:MAG: 16S rRNA (uracil1498-N3)-methyltransferase [bacterium]